MNKGGALLRRVGFQLPARFDFALLVGPPHFHSRVSMQFFAFPASCADYVRKRSQLPIVKLSQKKKLPIVKFGAVIQYAFASSLHLDALHEEF